MHHWLLAMGDAGALEAFKLMCIPKDDPLLTSQKAVRNAQ